MTAAVLTLLLHLPTPTPRWTVVDFWASWCEPCQTSAPFYEEQSKKWKSQGVVFVGVNQDDDPKTQQKWLSEHKSSFSQIYDKDHNIAHQLDVDTLPRLLIFDSKLHLVKTVRGFRLGESQVQLEKDFAELFSKENTKGETKKMVPSVPKGE